PDSSVVVIDYMEWMHPHTHDLGRALFVQGVCALPSVYGFLFEQSREPGILSRSMRWLGSMGVNRMRQLLDEIKPTIVVSTFPPAAAALSTLKEKRLTQVPTVTVITDHTDHSYWIHPYTDLYLVGSEHVRLLLQARGVALKSIRVTGIPV